ncbi:rRNA-processing protein EBP2 [Paramarasmius palmivorus]|uniref:rRNA-processing protein EBP2 n=1 Tax=Paramarasmius palmivorus TaxID=297713 RepID=A0AAW0CFF7_9AGAR
MAIASAGQIFSIYERFKKNPTDVQQREGESEEDWLKRIREGADYTIPWATKEFLKGCKDGQSLEDWMKRYYTNHCSNRGKSGETKPVIQHLPTPSPPSPDPQQTSSNLFTPTPDPPSTSRSTGKAPELERITDDDSDDDLVVSVTTRRNAWKAEKKDLLSKMGCLRTENASLREEIETLRAQAGSRQDGSQRAASETTMAEKEGLRKKVEDEETARGVLQAKLKERDTTLAAKTQEVDALREELSRYKHAQEENERKKNDLEASLNEKLRVKTARVLVLENALQDTRMDSRMIQEDIRELSKMKDELLLQSQRFEEELTRERALSEDARGRLEGLQEETAELTGQVTDLKGCIAATFANDRILLKGLASQFANAAKDLSGNDSPNARAIIKACEDLERQLNALARTKLESPTGGRPLEDPGDDGSDPAVGVKLHSLVFAVHLDWYKWSQGILRGSVDLMITVLASTNDDLERVSVQILTSPHGPQNGASVAVLLGSPRLEDLAELILLLIPFRVIPCLSTSTNGSMDELNHWIPREMTARAPQPPPAGSEFHVPNAVEGMKTKFLQEWSREATEEEASIWNNSNAGKSMTCWTCTQLKVQCTPGSPSKLPCTRCIHQKSETICTRVIEERRERVKRVMNLDEETFTALRATCNSSPSHQRTTSPAFPPQETTDKHRAHAIRNPSHQNRTSAGPEVIDLTGPEPARLVPPKSPYRSISSSGHPFSGSSAAEPQRQYNASLPPPPPPNPSFGVFPVARSQTAPYRTPSTSAARARHSPYRSPPIATRTAYTYVPDHRMNSVQSPISPPTSAHSGPPPSSASSSFSFSYPPSLHQHQPASAPAVTTHYSSSRSNDQNHSQHVITAVQHQIESLNQVNHMLARRNQEMYAFSEDYARKTRENLSRASNATVSGVAVKQEDNDETPTLSPTSLQEQLDNSRRINRRLIQQNSNLQKEVDELKGIRRSGSEGEPTRMLGQMQLSSPVPEREGDLDMRYPGNGVSRKNGLVNGDLASTLQELKDAKARSDGMAARLEEEMSENHRLRQFLADQHPSRSTQAQNAIAEHTNLQLLIRTLEQARTKGEISRVCEELRQVAARMLEHVPRGFGWEGIVRVLGHGSGPTESTMGVQSPAGGFGMHTGPGSPARIYNARRDEDSLTRTKRRRVEGGESSA